MRRRLRLWWARVRCAHHWHAADPMIGIACCWCGQDSDGWPDSGDRACRYDGLAARR